MNYSDILTVVMAEEIINIILLSIKAENNIPVINYYFNGGYHKAIVKNPDTLHGSLITGTEISIRLTDAALFSNSSVPFYPEAELFLREEDFLPEGFSRMLEAHPPEMSAYFGLISKPENNRGRYYMLRDHNSNGLLLCTGEYTIKDRVGRCGKFDGQWKLRYNMIENFFYGFERPECGLEYWKHPEIKLKKIDDKLSWKKLNKRHRNYAAQWHRFNFFYSDDWSVRFYRKQAVLGFIAITHTENGSTKLTPQLQREYAVLDWSSLAVDSKVKKILRSGRMKDDNIRLHINPDPDEVLNHLRKAWIETWITEQYASIIKTIAEEGANGKNSRVRIWGVCLSAGGENEVVAGELGYTIGKTYTSLSGFFHRGQKQYNNFGKLQMVLLAEYLKEAGISFWNLGQPYMDYKIRLGAEVVPRGLFLKRWDKAVRGRTVVLNSACKNK